MVAFYDFLLQNSLSLSHKPSTTLSYPYNILLWGPTIVNGQQPFFLEVIGQQLNN